MSVAKIRLGGPTDSNDFVELTVLEYGTMAGQSEGDLRLGVSVRSGEFSGRYDGVWIARAEWMQFIVSLKQLELERRGHASLISIASDEFELHLQIIDIAGHLVARGYLARYLYGRKSGIAGRSRIEYEFPVDPSLLRELLMSFIEFGDSTHSNF